jgi:hypothetical protein
MKKILFPMILLCWIGLLSQAAAEASQDGAQAAYAEIVFVQGSDILIIRSNGQTVNEDPIGMRLSTGDQVQTGAKTSVELVTMPRRSRLRLSENTVVTMGNLGNDGSTTLNLLYGRLRSKVEKLAGNPSPYKVSSPSFVAGVRGTDFGCDVLVSRPGENSSTRVYCFEGSVEVGPSAPEAAEAAKSPENAGSAGGEGATGNEGASKTGFAPVLVSAGSMAVIGESNQGGAIGVVEKPIDAETTSFWKANEFTSAQPIGAAPISAPELPTATPAPLPAPAIDLTPIRKGIAEKNNAMIGACVFFSVGAAIMASSFYARQTDSALGDDLLRGGAIFATMGLPALIFSISIDPLRGVKP